LPQRESATGGRLGVGDRWLRRPAIGAPASLYASGKRGLDFAHRAAPWRVTSLDLDKSAQAGSDRDEGERVRSGRARNEHRCTSEHEQEGEAGRPEVLGSDRLGRRQ
jgi:hypothetical protein